MTAKDFALSLFFGRSFHASYELLDCMPNDLGPTLPRDGVTGHKAINTLERWLVNSHSNSLHIAEPISREKELSTDGHPSYFGYGKNQTQSTAEILSNLLVGGSS
jgi:hypothetical protein